MNEHYPFELPPLPYAYNALEPHISEKTMRFHHDKHFQAYVDNLNKALQPFPQYQDWSLKALVAYAECFPEELRTELKNNAGGVFNHDLYFDSMGPNLGQKPGGALAAAIDRTFGSLDAFREKLKEAALGQFGSGWAWLVYDSRCVLEIMKTANQNVPPLKVRTPILLTDVWEHAYYLDYQNRRAEYFDNWFQVVDWAKVTNRFPCG